MTESETEAARAANIAAPRTAAKTAECKARAVGREAEAAAMIAAEAGSPGVCKAKEEQEEARRYADKARAGFLGLGQRRATTAAVTRRRTWALSRKATLSALAKRMKRADDEIINAVVSAAPSLCAARITTRARAQRPARRPDCRGAKQKGK
jgi:hypothetical protein